MFVSELNMAVKIVITVMSALGFDEAAEGMGTLYNLSKNLKFRSKDSKEVFMENLQNGISATINSENIDISVQEMVNCTFDRYFHEDDLLEYYDKKDELVKILLRSGSGSSTIGKDYEAFEKLVRTIITSLYDNIYEFIKTGKLVSEALKYLLETRNDIKALNITTKETNANVKKLVTAVGRIEEVVSPDITNTQIYTSTIVDDNEEYNASYTKTLFMEKAVGDNKAASLKDVFIKPSLENEYITLEDKLKTWRNSPNKKDKDNKYTYANAPVFLLYGKAGVGKSSFTSHIIFENILGDKCHAVALRKYADKLNHKNSWQSVKEIYKCSEDKLYYGTVLTLDGLDEVCVLQRGFDGKVFIENLIDNLPDSVKILITSRNYEGYFNNVESTYDLIIATITWTNIQIEDWCKFYAQVHKCKEKWCNEFLNKYNKLEKHDKRKDIFCIPIILYICCVSEIDIGEHNSVAGIYDTAFRKIGEREHGRRHRSQELTESDKRLLDINWQYTKELAFQMFLNDTLESALDNALVNAAKSMTAKICNTTEMAIRPATERYYAVFHFVSKNMEGIEFAHKTVGEYFTAVKLYEDYFANTLTDMSNESIEDMWKNIFQAFRYKKIPVDIMKYFIELVKSRKTTYEYTEDVKSYSEWRNCFVDSYYKGMQEQLLWKMTSQDAYYISKDKFLLMEQIAVVFRNLTWFLAMINFDNRNIIATENEIYIHMIESFFIRYLNMDVNLRSWQNLGGANLSGANLKSAELIGADLSRADLTDADLNRAHLNHANLSHADLSRAHLNRAHLNGAHLIGTDLTGAYLSHTDLNHADLSHADLNGADLNGADLNGANLTGAYLNGAHLNGAHLIGADLNNVHLFESDLLKFDNFIKKYGVKLIDPIIDDVNMTKFFYDSETNRIRPK